MPPRSTIRCWTPVDKPLGQAIEMLVAFGQYQRRAAFANGLEHVVADELIAGLIRDQFRVKFLKLDSQILGQGSDGRNPVGRT